MLKTNSVKDALANAAQIIRLEGLAKGQRRAFNGGLCIHGAVAVALFGRAYDSAETADERALQRRAEDLMIAQVPGAEDDPYVMRARGDPFACALAEWNNDPARTQAEVIDVLERAAAAGEGSSAHA